MTLSSILPSDHALVCDGAMGTMILSKGVSLGQSFDEVNLTDPGLVEDIHKAYVESGAEIIETNTFGANRLKLEGHGLGHKVRDINIAGAQIARKCASGKAFIAGSVGPTGRLMEPFGPLGFESAYDAYREQIMALCEGGVDLLIIETIQDLREAKAALLAAKTVTEIPVICQMSFAQEGRSMMGTDPATAAVVLSAYGASMVGANCGTGPQDMLDVVRAMAGASSIGITAQPNAGFPQMVEGRLMYLSTPDYMADFARQFVEAGAALVGGCCGTTPEHIRAISSSVSGMAPLKRKSDGITRVASRTKLIEIGTGNPMRTGITCLDLDSRAVKDAGGAARYVETAQSLSSAALCLVGSDIKVLEEALRAVEGRPLAMLRVSADSLLPIAKRYGSAVISRAEGETPEEQLRSARRIVHAAEQVGLDRSSILIQANENTLALIKSDLKVNTVSEADADILLNKIAS